MRSRARDEADQFWIELTRLRTGLDLLRDRSEVSRAFRMMNDAIAFSANGKYDSWRPFQIGFLLANLPSLIEDAIDIDTADVIWFATGGGKTETYLGLLVMAAFLDRIAGKPSGVTAWSRFPLRMLSLQQTQRFADAMARARLGARSRRRWNAIALPGPSHLPLLPSRHDRNGVRSPYVVPRASLS
jgi:hypothetical protein